VLAPELPQAARQQQALAEAFAASRPMALRRQLAAVAQLGRLQVRPSERYARETDENALKQAG
jgi:hypothetical protein